MAVCRLCGADLPSSARFCASCGVAVSARSGEERKVISVLFADLVGSTATGSGQDPEDVGAAIRPQLARMREALERHGGTVEKYIGDAVMAVFGAPIAHEDDPERAVRAALSIREALGESARVAVNTGEAVVSLGARAERGEEIVLGDVVNTAFRIEEAAPDGSVLVGEWTYRATKDAIEYGRQRMIAAKGKPDPLPVWEALRPRSVGRAVYDRTPLTPLVGRQEELTLILDTLARAKRHRTAQLMTLSGVPGIGKSRLVWELQRALQGAQDAVTWRRGRCLPYGEGVTYWALDEMVKAEAGILETDDSDAAAEKLRRSVRKSMADESEATWVETHLRPLLGMGSELTGERREEAFSAWRRYVEALAEGAPLVLVFEDLHWADDGMLDFIEHLADWSRDVPLLLLCTARPELYDRRDGWGGHRNALNVTVAPLTDEETTELLSLLLSRRSLSDHLRETLLARADGNPLYAEEFMRMLADRDLLAQRPGGWVLEADELPLPESVQGLIASRLDALTHEEKSLIQAAAVVGRTFSAGAVSAVAERNADKVAPVLGALDLREVVRRHRVAAADGGAEYGFRHALVRDVAYGQIPRALRAEKHLLAAQWIESLGRLHDQSETAAHHYLAAVEYVRAVGDDVAPFSGRARAAFRRAGDRALALNAYAAAARFFAGALELSPPADERPSLLFCYGKSLSRTVLPDEEVLVQARDAMLAAGDPEGAAECLVILGELLWRRGRREEAFAELGRAVAMVERRPASYAQAYALSTLSRLRMARDEPEEARNLAEQALKMAEQLGFLDMRADALITIGVARVTTGDHGGLDDLERSIEIAEAANSPQSIRGYLNLGSMLANLGELRPAAALHSKGHQLAERFGDGAWIEWFDVERVYQRYWAGEWDAAWSSAERVLAEIDGGGSQRGELDARLVRAWIALARGEIEGALADSERAVDIGRAAGDPQDLYPGLALYARTLAAAGRATEAKSYADELLGLMRERPSLPSFWVIDLAIALVDLGRRDELAAAAALAPPTRWLEAARAYVSADPTLAAMLCSEIGALPEEAYVRVEAAATALADGRRAEAEEQIAEAIKFYRRVGAVSYCRQAEAMLAA